MSAEMTMRCEDVAPYLSAFADGELPQPLCSEVAEHVATCDACSATLARYAKIDSLVAAMPRSAPSPETLDQILANVAAEDEQEERRNTLRSVWNIEAFKRRFTEMDLPVADAPTRIHAHTTQRSRWVSVAIPAIAALLLISVTLVTFHWLPSKGGQVLPTTQATATPAPGSKTLQTTFDAVNAIQKQLAFRAVLPSYLPDGATLYDVTIGPHESEISEHTLDIFWSVGDPAHMIHLHEAPAAVGLTGYTELSSTSEVAWQIGNTPWRQVRVDGFPKNMAVEQRRQTVAIALDVSIQANSSQAAAGQTTLRLISLSMDSKYIDMPTAPNEKTARILPVPSIDKLVAHYKAVALNGTGSTAWREEVYVAPCASTADPCQVSASYWLGSSGAPIFNDIASGQRLLHLDQAQKTFTWLPLLPSAQGANLSNTALPKLFYLANTYLSTGILWYMGEATYQGERVYNLLWTSAPNQTHVYVSKTTHQVIAMSVDSPAKIQTGGPIAGTGALSCMRYTMLEYIASSATTDAAFAQTIPTGFTESQDPQLNLTC
jgi:hypothetical protein